MSETVKLIIEIPKSALELLNTTGVDWLGAEHILSAVAEGIPLDDVKEKIAKLRLVGYADALGKFAIASKAVMDVLDNIGKGDSKC